LNTDDELLDLIQQFVSAAEIKVVNNEVRTHFIGCRGGYPDP
jgi:hypothetical protein